MEGISNFQLPIDPTRARKQTKDQNLDRKGAGRESKDGVLPDGVWLSVALFWLSA